MDQFQVRQTSRWTKREAGLESLTEWIDLYFRHSPSQPWGVWGGIVGGSAGLVSGLMATLSIDHKAPPFVFLLPLVVWVLGALGSAIWLARRVRTNVVWDPESKNLMSRLFVARWHGSLRDQLGQEGSEILNTGAGIYLQTWSALESPQWNAAANSPVWREMQRKAQNSLRSAMGRLVVQVANGTLSDTDSILADMQALKDEVLEASNRHAANTGVGSLTNDTLRQTLREFKELREADQEIQSEIKLDH